MSSFGRISQNKIGNSYAGPGDPDVDAFNEATRREREVLERRARGHRAWARKRRRAQLRRRRLVALLMLGVLIFGMWNIVSAFTASSGRATTRHVALVAWKQFARGPSSVVPGRLAAFTWPDKGEAAVGIQGAGVIAHSPRERIVPIASMTKMMTAILILKDHPLLLGELGPAIALSAADAKAWVIDSQNGDSVVRVRAGEHLNEFQLLEALLMSSGDNIADIL